MKKYRFGALLIFCVVLLFFVVFPDYLLLGLIENPYLPLGTILTWIGFISWTTFFYFSSLALFQNPSNSAKRIKRIFQFLLLLSLLWIFIGYGLANNWAMSFSGSISDFRGSYKASLVYWGFDYFLFFAPILVFFIYLILKKLKKI
jgi:hypothetical protein